MNKLTFIDNCISSNITSFQHILVDRYDVMIDAYHAIQTVCPENAIVSNISCNVLDTGLDIDLSFRDTINLKLPYHKKNIDMDPTDTGIKIHITQKGGNTIENRTT